MTAASDSPPRLSLIVITRNAGTMIERCLGSVPMAGERIVLDSGSSDDTVARARALGARVEQTLDWPGFGPQKNRALASATGDWVLSLDADEWLSPELAAEIEALLANPSLGEGSEVFTLPRLSTFLGRPMRHGGWWPDAVPRLFRRGAARFSDDAVHERLLFATPAAALRGVLHHESYRDLPEVLEKLARYAEQGAQQAARRGRRGGLLAALTRSSWTFLRAYLLRRGILDGRAGLIAALYQSQATFWRYLRLAELTRPDRPESRAEDP